MKDTTTDDTKDLEKYEARRPAIAPQSETALTQQESFLSAIERLSSNPSVDVEKIKQMVEIQEHLLDRTAEQAFNAAMMRAQNKIELVVAKEYNEQTHSNYADLKAVLIQSKPIYTTEGFSLMFYEGETEKEGHKRVCVDIMHEQGCTKKRYGDFAIQTTGIAGKAMMTQIHGEGSAFSYGRRYLTCMIFNIPTGDDDDGNTAGKPPDPISAARIKEINNLIKSTGADKTKFMIWMKNMHGTAKVEELTKDSANQVLATLKEKQKEKGSNNGNTSN